MQNPPREAVHDDREASNSSSICTSSTSTASRRIIACTTPGDPNQIVHAVEYNEIRPFNNENRIKSRADFERAVELIEEQIPRALENRQRRRQLDDESAKKLMVILAIGLAVALAVAAFVLL